MSPDEYAAKYTTLLTNNSRENKKIRPFHLNHHFFYGSTIRIIESEKTVSFPLKGGENDANWSYGFCTRSSRD